MELIHLCNHAFTHLSTPSLCTDKILLLTTKRNTTQAVWSQRKEIYWFMYLENPRVLLASHTGGLNHVPKCLSSSSFPSSSFLLLLFLLFPFSRLLPLIFPSFSQAFSLWQVKELPAALNKHPSSLATLGREVVYCWSQLKISPGGLWSRLRYMSFLETNFCHLTFGIVWLARLGTHGQGGECKGSSSAPSNHRKCVQDTEET